MFLLIKLINNYFAFLKFLLKFKKDYLRKNTKKFIEQINRQQASLSVHHAMMSTQKIYFSGHSDHSTLNIRRNPRVRGEDYFSA